MLAAGRLRERITIRRATETRNNRGGYTTSWADFVTIAAEVIGLDGRESLMDQVLQGISTYRVTIRWRADLLDSDQMRSTGSCFGGRDVNIRSIVDPDRRREQLVIIADTASTRSN
jgi:SPP1 family predicted phage head-tail adaptor